MIVAARGLYALAAIWSAGALLFQCWEAWGGGRRDYSRPAGSPVRGTAYSFTVAMMPAHKESVSRHPVKFGIGLVMHAGVVLCLLGSLVLVVHSAAGFTYFGLVRPVTVLSLIAAAYLAIRRSRSRNLGAMNAPDDYLAITATAGLLAFVAFLGVTASTEAAFLLYTALVLAYMPLGKLKHAVFFYLARGDYGRRLGYRGVYPPAAGAADRADG